MGEMVIVAYRPKPGCDEALLALMREHVPDLRRWGLATDKVALMARAADGTIVEMFEWVDGGAAAAHEHPDVQALWGRYGAVSEFVPLRELPETTQMFATFAGIDP